MISIWPKKKMSVAMEHVLEVPIQVIPDLPPLDSNQAIGREFNLVAMVREHAPKRLESIKKEVQKLEKQLYTLGVEAGQLEALLASLK